MQIVIDISNYDAEWINNEYCIPNEINSKIADAIITGTPLPELHSFIAICDSDFPITEEVIQELKNTAFVGNEDCSYCFGMTEIIETDKEEEE